MALPAKRADFKALLAKEETTYGTAVSLAAADDGIRMFDPDRSGIPFERTVAFDGDLGETVSTFGPTKRSGQSGLAVSGNIPIRARGAGAAYSATVLPNVHRLMKASGFTATIVTTASSETVTYALDTASATPTSLTAELYAHGEKWPVTGMICAPSFTFDNAAPPVWTFAARGIYGAIVDAAVAAPTYPQDTVVPPLSSAITLTFGSFTSNAIAYSGSFDMQRNIDNPRVALTGSGAHKGFLGRSYRPVAKVVVEATARVGSPYHTSAGLDPELLVESGQSFAFSFVFGATQYNKWKMTFAQAQAIDAKPVNLNGTACYEMTIAGYNSAGSTSDAVSFLFD